MCNKFYGFPSKTSGSFLDGNWATYNDILKKDESDNCNYDH